MNETIFIIPRKREELLSCSSVEHYYVSEIINAADLFEKITECVPYLEEKGCYFILDNFPVLYSVLCHFDSLSFETLQCCYKKLIIPELNVVSNSLLLLLEDDDLCSETKVRMLNVIKMSIYIAVEFLRLFREKVEHTYNLVINKRGQKNSKFVKLKEEHDWDWEDNERLALDIILKLIKQPIRKLWEPVIPDEEFIRIIENCCYYILEKPSVTSAKMKQTRDIIFEILAILIVQYNNAISCQVKIVQMLKLYEHLVYILAQAVIFFVQKFNCRSLIKEVIKEIVEAGSEFDQNSSQEQTCFRAFSSFIVELATHVPELVLPCVNILSPNLNCDPYIMRICVLTVMAEIVANVLRLEAGSDLSQDDRMTRDGFLEHLLDHIVDVHVFVRSRVLKLFYMLYHKDAVPKHIMHSLFNAVIQRLYDKSGKVVKNSIRLLTLILQKNPFGALLNDDSVKTNLAALKSKIIASEIILEKPSLFKIWFCLRSEFSEYISVWLKSEKSIQLTEVASKEEDADVEPDLNQNTKEKMSVLLSEIKRCLLDRDFKNLLLTLRNFEDVYIKRVQFLTEINDIVQYYQWILGNVCIEDENIVRIFKLSSCSDSSQIKDCINQDLTSSHSLETDFGPDYAVFTYCEDFLNFIGIMRSAVSVVGELMIYSSTVEILEAIEFLKTAHTFSISGVEKKVMNMLLLIHSKDTAVKDAVVKAYKSMYLNVEISDPYEQAVMITSNLAQLLKTLSYEQLEALNNLIRLWAQKGDIGDHFVQALLDKYSRNVPNCTSEDFQTAIILLTMYANEKPEIIRKNVNIISKYGLVKEVSNNYQLVLYSCRSLRVLFEIKNEFGITERYPMCSDFIEHLASLVINNFTNLDNEYYSEIVMEAITVIYQLSEHPDNICGKVLHTLLKKINKSAVTESEEKSINEELCLRFLLLLSHVAFRHWYYLETDVCSELKRRNAEESKRKNRKSSRIPSEHQGRKNALKKNKNKDEDCVTDNFEDDALAMADEQVIESIREVCENELFSETNLFSPLSDIVVKVCLNQDKSGNVRLQSAASIALSKLMIISSKFCEKNLQLFITIMEKTPAPEVKINLILAFGDLTFRFPNKLEPWTIYFYNRLRDESDSVRFTALLVVSHLITNEMIKVRGQMSDVALCLVDVDNEIRSCAHDLFYELSIKGNSLYNVMPEIISRLSHPDYRPSEENFKVILKTLMKLINKERHQESIVEKICHRFGGAADERQCIDLSYCLTLISYSERSVLKLIDNLLSYAEKLTYPRVHRNFTNIIIASKKQAKVGKMIDAIEELENKIDIVLTRGIHDLDIAVLKRPKTPAKFETSVLQKTPFSFMKNSTKSSNKRKPKKLSMSSESEVSE